MTVLVPQILFLLVGVTFWLLGVWQNRRAMSNAQDALDHLRRSQKLCSDSKNLVLGMQEELDREKKKIEYLEALCDLKDEKMSRLEQMATQLGDDMTGVHVLDVLYTNV